MFPHFEWIHLSVHWECHWFFPVQNLYYSIKTDTCKTKSWIYAKFNSKFWSLFILPFDNTTQKHTRTFSSISFRSAFGVSSDRWIFVQISKLNYIWNMIYTCLYGFHLYIRTLTDRDFNFEHVLLIYFHNWLFFYTFKTKKKKRRWKRNC